MSCLFCDADVREGTGKKKRKLIFGKKCEQVLSILDNLCLVHYNRKFSDAPPVNHDELWVCHRCIGTVMDLPVLLQKVTDLKNNILCFVKNSGLLPEARSMPPAESDAAVASRTEESCHDSVLASSTTPTSAKDSSILGKSKRSDISVGVAVRPPF